MPPASETRLRVRYAETDQMGVVYYANYLRFFEGARGEWIRGLGLSYAEIEDRGIFLPVLEASVRYLKPARSDDVHLALRDLDGVDPDLRAAVKEAGGHRAERPGSDEADH